MKTNTMKIYRGQELVGVIHRDAMYDFEHSRIKTSKRYVKAKGRLGSNQWEKKKKRSDWPIILFVYIFVIVLLAVTIKVWDTYSYPPLISPIPKAGAQGVDGVIDPEVYTPTPTPKAALASPTVTPRPTVLNKQEIKDRLMIAAIEKFTTEEALDIQHLVNGESGFNPTAVNKTTGACGIFQALPCSKMGCNLSKSPEDIDCQIKWGLQYVKNRYGTPNNAYQFWLSQSPHWY